jgi:hypothetical protein
MSAFAPAQIRFALRRNSDFAIVVPPPDPHAASVSAAAEKRTAAARRVRIDRGASNGSPLELTDRASPATDDGSRAATPIV